MALGLVWVAWISLLLDSSVFTEAQGTSFRQTNAKLNLVDVNDFAENLSLDEGEGEPEVNKISRVVNKDYKKSPAAQPLKLFSVTQNVDAKPQATVGRIVNGASRQWESNEFEPITFPLQSGSQKVSQTQPIPSYESQSAPAVSYGARKPAYPSIGELTTGIQQAAKPKPVQSPNLAVLPPSFESWQPVFNEGVEKSVSGPSYQQQAASTNAASPGLPDPFSEESNLVEFSPDNFVPQRQPARKYPPVVSKPQMESWSTPEWHGQNNEIGSSLNFAIPTWLGFPHTDPWFSNSYVASRGHQPDFSMSYNKYLSPKGRAPEQVNPLPPRKSFVLKSKNGYQRRRLVKSKTTYTPDYKLPKGKYGKSVKVLRGAVKN